MEASSWMFGAARKLGKWLFGIIEKQVCRRAYELSTLYHDHRELIEMRPFPLGEHLGHRLFWGEYLLGQRQRAPMIEVRANPGVRLSKVVISVLAANDKLCYQDEVVLRHIDERRHRAALPAIPFRCPKIEGDSVRVPYDHFRVELIAVLDECGNDLLPPSPVVHISYPVDRLEVALGKEVEHVAKWGRVYNLQFIDRQIKEEMVRILAWQFHRSSTVRWIAGRLKNRRVAKTLFWAKNAFRARPLQRELERHIAEYKEYEADRLKREGAAVRAEEGA